MLPATNQKLLKKTKASRKESFLLRDQVFPCATAANQSVFKALSNTRSQIPFHPTLEHNLIMRILIKVNKTP